MQNIGIAYHELFIKHDAGPDHPECPERVEAVMEAIKSAPWSDIVEIVEAPEASQDDVARVHDPKYVDAMRRLCNMGGQYLAPMESNVGPESYPAAIRAVGAGMILADNVMAGKWKIGFAPTRPAGHHAVYNRPMGFCIFCSIAVLARYIQDKYKLERICIIDFDVHHGNGTEAAFWRDPTVLYCSLHRDNLFPYNKGRRADTGEGEGEGYTLNIPLPAECNDVVYLEAFDSYVNPRVEEFNPQIVLVSAGFDSYYKDIIGDMMLTGQAYEAIADRLLKLANRSADGRIITLLEGGYNLDGLKEGVTKYLGRLIEG